MRLLFTRILSILLCYSFSLNIYGLTREYQASYDNPNWQAKTSRLLCELNYEIPEYGILYFSQHAGMIEQVDLNVLYGRGLTHRRGVIQFNPPAWRSNLVAVPGWKFQFTEPGELIRFSARQARQLLDNLDLGLMATIVHRDKTNLRNEVRANILPVLFQAAYQEYIECQANIIPVTFAQVRRSNVYFETGSVRLDATAKQWLGYVIEYAKDTALRRLELGGYTDSIGSFRANHKLASARVEKVREYLMNAGFTDRQIKVRVYGEQRAIVSNKTVHGRAQNRRVEIKIYR